MLIHSPLTARRWYLSQQTRAQYAAPKRFLQRLRPTVCTSILRFTDISATAAGRSSPWSCFARDQPDPS
jgi:hypothetical protein